MPGPSTPDDAGALEIIDDAPRRFASPGETWRILIVDDDPDVHVATALALRDLIIEGRPLAFSHAYSAQEAQGLLASDGDWAVILLDMVMESEDAGLRLVRWIREERRDPAIRVILRTGQTGHTPEIDIIRAYDINDYKTKVELTRIKLFTSLTVAIRSYRQIHQLETSRRGMERQEQDLRHSRAKLRELTAHREKAREEERAYLARELHDELGQYLTAIRMEASLIELRFAQHDGELQQRLTGMRDLIDHVIGGVRRVISRLRPAALDLGLVSAAEWLAADYQERTGTPCRLDVPHAEALQLDDERATTLFRILQESLTNVARHAQATRVEIGIQVIDGQLQLEVRDDGRGFDPMVVREKKTFGLMGIRERVLIYGGSARIDTRPGHGTRLVVSLPLGTGGRP